MNLGALAERAGTSVGAIAYDAMVAGSMLLMNLFNYTHGNHDVLFEQMADPAAVLGLDDAGAHCGAICDASIPTYVLTHWVRDRRRGPRLELSDAVRRLTSQPADLYGFADRGRLARACGPTSTSSTSSTCGSTPPGPPTTSRPAGCGSSRTPAVTGPRSSPAKSPVVTALTRAPGRGGCSGAERPIPVVPARRRGAGPFPRTCLPGTARGQ